MEERGEEKPNYIAQNNSATLVIQGEEKDTREGMGILVYSQ